MTMVRGAPCGARSGFALVLFALLLIRPTPALSQSAPPVPPASPPATADSVVQVPAPAAHPDSTIHPVTLPAHVDTAAHAIAPVSLEHTCQKAEKDADEDQTGLAFGIAGCVVGPLAVPAAMLWHPAPPAAKLTGLPPEASAEYARCYGRKAQRKNLKASLQGFAAAVIVATAIFYYTDSKTAP